MDIRTTEEKYREALEQAHKNYGNGYYIRKVMALKEELYREQKQEEEGEKIAQTDTRTTEEKYSEAVEQAFNERGNGYYIRKVMALKEELYKEQKQAREKKQAHEKEAV